MIKDFFAGRVSPSLAFLIALLGDQLVTVVIASLGSVFFDVFGGLFGNFDLFDDRSGVTVGFAMIFGIYVMLPAVFTFVYIRSINVFPATSGWRLLQILGVVILLIKVVGGAVSIGALGYMAYTDISANG